MMLIMSIACLFKTLNRYIRLAESFYYVNYVQSDVFQILEKNLQDMVILEDIGYFLAGFRSCQLFPGLFQIVPG